MAAVLAPDTLCIKAPSPAHFSRRQNHKTPARHNEQ
jgi:hypothetical protein